MAGNATMVEGPPARRRAGLRAARPGVATPGEAALPLAPGALVLFDGDSIAAGQGASPKRGLARQVQALLPRGTRVVVTAVSGRPAQQCLALYDTTVAPAFDVATSCVIFFHAGDNDIAQGGTAAEAYAALRSYVARAHAQGWAVVVSTEMQRFDFLAEGQREIDAYNALLRADRAGADGLADFGADPLMGGAGGRSDPARYTADGVHPTDGGYAVLARVAAASLLPLLRGRS